ncbi:MAG: class I SAM-dependent methyltransferase [Planctomycetota bacterium]
MTGKNANGDFQGHSDESRAIWDANAEWWDDRIGDGNDFQCELIEPATERLIDAAPGKTILDIACGAGRFGRRMAALGARVVAFDFSERFIHRARERTPKDMRNIEYHVIDATDREQMRLLGAGRFDGAVATMCLMDMATITPLFGVLPELLKPGGWFVFSIMHPCFQPPGFRKFAEMHEEEDGFVVRAGVQITSYITPAVWKGDGIVGQPQKQYYFHRPLSLLLNTAFQHGFVMDGIEEPTFREKPAEGRYLRWDAMPEIPPVVVVLLRLAGAK